MVRAFPHQHVYCFHEIVHNQVVVERFEALGVVFVNDIDEVPEGSPIMLSAHGSAPEVVAAARARGSYVVDAVCPLVTKVHHEVKVRAGKGFRIVYVGHEGHEEAVGTMAVAPESISRVESVAEVDALPTFDQPVALLAQTTLSHRDWSQVAVAVKQKYPDAWTPGRSDLCFATTNRQSALMAMAERCDAIVVIGSANSSNTRALESLARDVGCARVFRINDASELPVDLEGTVGVTAGASAPEELVDAVLHRLAPAHGIELVKVTDEDEYFPPPRSIRELQSAIGIAAAVLLGADPATSGVLDDRRFAAADALVSLRTTR
jgi:4-hydroxy-3-methylbut-2-en-1-yl diphosphate reductase